jgi:3,4-dihydroxy 2-butanone 4-phosphate synthase/GTP cyclohydrolase II
MQNTLCDLFSTRRADCPWPLHSALRQIAEAGEGAVVVLRNHDTARELVQRIADYQLHDAEDKVPVRDPDRELRTYGVGAQIIGDLGIRKMRVLSAPWSIHGLAGFGLEVVEYVDCQ